MYTLSSIIEQDKTKAINNSFNNLTLFKMDTNSSDWIMIYPSADDINKKLSSALIPHIVILGLYILIGIIGNSTVIHVYLYKMRESTDSRFFVPCLAIADILACTIGGFCGILMSNHIVDFNNDLGCKMIWYLMTAITSGAAMILVFIAYHRYTKICRPYNHTNLMEKKITIVICLYVTSFVISSPLIFTSGVTTFTRGNNTFQTCERISGDYIDGMKFNIAIGYTVFEALVVITIATLMTIFYTKVGLKLFHHFKQTSRNLNSLKASNIENEEHSRDSVASIDSQLSVEIHENKPSNSSNNTAQTASKRIKRKKEKFNRKHKYTFIFIAISVICIVTYTPRLTLMIIESADRKFWFKSTSNLTLFPFLKFLNRFYIVNNIVNPFLYAMFDPKFKRCLINIFTCTSQETQFN